MAETTLSLAEQYLLKEKEDTTTKLEEVIPIEKAEEVPVAKESTDAVAGGDVEPIPAATLNSNESAPAAIENITVDASNATEESSERNSEEVSEVTPEETPAGQEAPEETPADQEVSEETPADQEVSEETPEIKLETAPADFRFPTTNQTRHCFTRYIEYHRCVAAKGEDAQECDKFAKYYRALCPSEWVERWNEQRENGTFAGPL